MKNISNIKTKKSAYFCEFTLFRLFITILCAGFILRVIIHLNGPLGFDEVYTWFFAKKPTLLSLWKAELSETTPPLYDSIIHFVIYSMGDTPALMRIPSLIFGVLVLPLTFWIMRIGTFTKMDGLCAMALASVSSMLVYYSQELRAYSMLACTGILSVGMLLHCLKKPSGIKSLLFALIIFIVPQIHRYGLLLIAAEFVCIILYRQWRLLYFSSVSLCLIILVFVLTLLAGKFHFSDAIDVVTRLSSVVNLISMLNAGISLGNLTATSLDSPSILFPQLSINIILCLAGLIGFSMIFLQGIIYVKDLTQEQKKTIIVLSICIAVPTILALIAGSPLSPQPQWMLRGLIYIWPLYYMVAVAASSKSRFKIYLIAAIIFINAFSLYSYYTNFNRCPEAPALEKLSFQTTSSDLIVANPYYFFGVIMYYYHGKAPIAGYDRRKGWVDIQKLQESNDPLVYNLIPLTTPPTVSGNVYFFWKTDGKQNLKPFTKNNIFVYDSTSSVFWEKLELPPD